MVILYKVLPIILIAIPVLMNGQSVFETETDSSTISVFFSAKSDTYYETNNLNNSPYSYCRELYHDQKTVKREGRRYYDSYIGKWNYYNRQGENYMVVNYSRISRKLIDTTFVYQAYWNRIREKADSIVKSYYSADFFENHIKLNASKTTWERHDEGAITTGLWFELFNVKPDRFTMAYLIMISPKQGFSFIQFDLDKDGRLVKYFKNKGLHVVNKCCFEINAEKILQLIEEKNLEDNANTEPEWNLVWNESKQDLEIRVNYARFVNKDNNKILKTRTFFINPWNGESTDVIERERP